MSKIQLIATAAFGLEAVVSRELKHLGYADQALQDGVVNFTGDEEAICRTNMWLRSAGRVLVKVGEFKALTFDELFEGTKALPWEDWLPEDAEFPVIGKSIHSTLFSVSDCQAIVKKAIVERLKLKYKRQWFDETGPRYKVEIGLLKDMATLTIDTSGAGLHKRGYRKIVGEAPIKETLASAMLQISHWNRDRVLWDPFCGSGTIAIEAAMIGLDMAPGMNREFVSQKWGNIANKHWVNARKEAKDMVKLDRKLRITATDIDEDAINLARYHARMAEVDPYIHFQRLPMKEVSSRYEYGCFVTNPPYGERLGEEEEIESLYREMGKVFKKFDTWSYYVITSFPSFEKLFGKPASKKRKLYNGMLQCNYYQYLGPKPPRTENKVDEAVEEK